jgi:hypothetical protein
MNTIHMFGFQVGVSRRVLEAVRFREPSVSEVRRSDRMRGQGNRPLLGLGRGVADEVGIRRKGRRTLCAVGSHAMRRSLRRNESGDSSRSHARLRPTAFKKMGLMNTSAPRTVPEANCDESRDGELW